jgi:hypothetical protein
MGAIVMACANDDINRETGHWHEREKKKPLGGHYTPLTSAYEIRQISWMEGNAADGGG